MKLTAIFLACVYVFLFESNAFAITVSLNWTFHNILTPHEADDIAVRNLEREMTNHKNHALFVALGTISMRYDLKKAMAAFKNAVHIKPDDYTSYILLGYIAAQLSDGDFSDSISYMRKATIVAPNEGVTYNALANTYLMAGMTDKARDILEKGKAANSSDSSLFYNQSIVLLTGR